MLVCIPTSSISMMTKPHCSTKDIVMSWQHHILTLQPHHHSTSTNNMTINTIYYSNVISWPPLMQPPLLQHSLPPPITPTLARKPSICHESSYSFSPIPIVLLSSVVIQFSSAVTYEPAYELLVLYVRSCQHTTNNHSKFKHNNHDHVLSHSMTMPPKFSKWFASRSI